MVIGKGIGVMDHRAVGVFDSGLGGLTVVRQLRKALPSESIVYFGDTGRVPYGTRAPETIERYAKQDCRFLLNHDVKMIIAACGTVSSVAGQTLDALPVPAIGVVQPAADAAIKATVNRKVGVIGTSATVRSGAFTRRLEAAGCAVFSQACPLFVSLVETGWIDADDPVVYHTAERYLLPLKEQGIDTLILGCTHFPLLSPVISRVLGDGITLIDTGKEAALQCAEQLRQRDGLNDTAKSGDMRFFVSDRPEGFSRVAAMFLGTEIDDAVTQIQIDEY